MDSKALAKSKRAHSLHLNKKHNPHHASKGSSAGSSTSAGDKKATTVKQVKEKPKSKLPSNWDRYEEENADSENATQKGASDVVEPKSKGADYAYLLSEAKSQFQYSSENVSFCDDILDDFYQGLGALLSAKGQSKLSWIAEDNFAMEDKAPPPTKASFLSLDLQALSEQLERASLSERLFIEPDLLPLELRTEESQAAPEEKHEGGLASSKSSTSEKDSISLTSASVYESNKNRNRHSEFSHLSSTTSRSRHPTLADESSNPSSAFKDEVGQSEGAGQNDKSMFASEFNTSSVAKKPTAFKAAAAEAELDMLLDSVTKIEISESTNVTDQSSRPYPVTQAGTPTPLSEGTSSKRGHDLAKPAISNISLDDTLDDLLKETSTVTNKTEGSSPNEVNSTAGYTPSASQPVSKPKIIDDFDSWFDTL
ncbi:protein ECERIFERUM 16 [Lycium barbarum]|uniref:protein ECERIFERUM 16 n=1 Tax=Lycium barbarum TaxID=112863 RepID=UPI00293F17D0|nr:protein ECERIFERUM 16 [Lycium barbarum]